MLISRPSVCSLPYNFGLKCNSWPLITSHKISRLIFQRDFPFSMAQHFSAGERDDKAFAATKKEIDRSRPPQNQPGSIRTVFHCTKRENVESILKTGFRFPTVDDAIARGLKLGAAVYFGTNVEYCFKEAVNTLLDETDLADSLETVQDCSKTSAA